MPGQFRYTVDRMGEELQRLTDAGVSSVMLFGIPAVKDEVGSQAYAEDGIVQRALRQAKKDFPDLYMITDVCMCEYTSHGHCGVLCGHDVDNDATLELLAKTALSHVEAGAQMVAPSDMMDGRVRAIRECRQAARRCEGVSHKLLDTRHILLETAHASPPFLRIRRSVEEVVMALYSRSVA